MKAVAVHPDMSASDAFGMYHQMLIRHAMVWFGPYDAADAVSDTWLEALRSWEKWRGSGSRKAWLVSILRYEQWAWLARKARLIQVCPLEAARSVATGGDIARDVERADLASKSWDSIDPVHRQRLSDWIGGDCQRKNKDAVTRALHAAHKTAVRLGERQYKTVRAMAREHENAS
jgi:DNA-directed RNA polymerase specialized sigma24 family protein